MIGYTEPPPEPSPKLARWLTRISQGWKPNRRIRAMGYSARADFFGVTVWEQLNVLDRALYPQHFRGSER